ncbi:transposase [uncultured Desulfovibrio sp.]|uniref:transposase n=1 Tax=uncultured Desulfovibrio sp. TaxID=167968 RepID=UPI003459FBF1
MRVTGETCSVVFDGALDGKIYNAYIEQFLLPTLKAGDMVIMDNLNVHKSKTAQKLITEKGCEYIFLPEYSPDLNPIEKMWSKVKQLLRSMKARTCAERIDLPGLARRSCSSEGSAFSRYGRAQCGSNKICANAPRLPASQADTWFPACG